MADSWLLGAVLNMTVLTHDDGTGDTTLSFDPAAGAADHTLYYGPLGAVSSHGYSGTVSGLGASGSTDINLPPGSLFWVIAPQNGFEGCYGTDSACNERPCYPDGINCTTPQAVNQNCSVPQCP
jgi:hypothetical protein